MDINDFDYDLPEELIAQTPLERRDASRLLVLDKNTGARRHMHFYDLPALLRPGDCLVLNDSRVLPARLVGHRVPGGGAAEVLLLIDRGDKVWECLVRPGRRLKPGARISFGDGALTAEVLEVCEGGNRLVRFDYEGIFLEKLEQLGKMPLPPYIKQELEDPERYQTVNYEEDHEGLRRRADGGTALYPCAAGTGARNGRKGMLRYTSCGPGDLPSGERRRDHRP